MLSRISLAFIEVQLLLRPWGVAFSIYGAVGLVIDTSDIVDLQGLVSCQTATSPGVLGALTNVLLLIYTSTQYSGWSATEKARNQRVADFILSEDVSAHEVAS